MAKVFADTSALLALAVEGDRNHARAARALAGLAESQSALWTSSYVVVEHVSILQSRRGVGAVRAFVDHMLPQLEVHWVDEALHREALDLLLAVGRRRVSLVDCASFVLLRRERDPQVFAFDPDFEAEGFRVLP